MGIYIVFMYCLFMPLTIAYVILLILYRSHYAFSNIIFMRSKRMMYLMFVAALMMVPVAIMMKWYISVIHYEWKAYWISIVCFDVFTWIIAFMYGFTDKPRTVSAPVIDPDVQPVEENVSTALAPRSANDGK